MVDFAISACAFQIVGISAFGIGLDRLVKGRDRFVRLIGIGENHALVVVIRSSVLRISLRRGAVLCHRLVHLSGPGVGVRQTSLVRAR